MKEIQSKIFGMTELLEESDNEYAELKELIEKYPASAFGFLNKQLNGRQYVISIERLPK